METTSHGNGVKKGVTISLSTMIMIGVGGPKWVTGLRGYVLGHLSLLLHVQVQHVLSCKDISGSCGDLVIIILLYGMLHSVDKVYLWF